MKERFASAVLKTTDNFTLPVGLRGFIDTLQKFIVGGLTQGSAKG